jgi:hypothetical protein
MMHPSGHLVQLLDFRQRASAPKLVVLSLAQFFERANFALGGSQGLLAMPDVGGSRLVVCRGFLELSAQRRFEAPRGAQFFDGDRAGRRAGANPLAVPVQLRCEPPPAHLDLAFHSECRRQFGATLIALVVSQGQKRLQAKFKMWHG